MSSAIVEPAIAATIVALLAAALMYAIATRFASYASIGLGSFWFVERVISGG